MASKVDTKVLIEKVLGQKENSKYAYNINVTEKSRKNDQSSSEAHNVWFLYFSFL